MFINPIDKSPLNLKENNDKIIKLLPQTKDEQKYIEHYKLDAELFDYFEERNCKATKIDELRLRNNILQKLNIREKDCVIMDVGSGNGWAAQRLTTKCKQFIAVDISETNLLKIKKNCNANNLVLLQADAMNMLIADNSIDYIIAAEVIEHLPEPTKFINEMYRIIKPNGKIIISTPYKEKIPYYLCVHCNQPTPKNAHLHSFDEHKLKELTKNCNNANVKFYIFGNKILHLFRINVLFRFLPLKIWLILDKLANLIINKPEHIIMTIEKK